MTFYRQWILASRPWSFIMTFISISVGSSLAYMDGFFSWHYYLVTLLAMIAMHAATNLLNDFYDVKNKVDVDGVSTAKYRPHPILEGKLVPSQVFMISWLLFAIVLAAGIYLSVTRGWEIFLLGIFGALASITYTAPPFKYKYYALGEFSVFLMWGPLMVEGAYFVQHRAFSAEAFWVSLPFGVLVALVLLGNNLRDMYHDREKGIKTIPIVVGLENGFKIYSGLIIAAYAAVLVMSITGPLPRWSLLVFATLPLAFRLLKQMKTAIPIDADARTAQLDTIFGLLLVISIIFGGTF